MAQKGVYQNILDNSKHIRIIQNGPTPDDIFDPDEFVRLVEEEGNLILPKYKDNVYHPGANFLDIFDRELSVDDYNKYAASLNTAISHMRYLIRELRRSNLPCVFVDPEYFKNEYNKIKNLPSERYDVLIFKLAKEFESVINNVNQMNIHTAKEFNIPLTDPKEKAKEPIKAQSKPQKPKIVIDDDMPQFLKDLYEKNM